ncbi:MAG: DUF1015 domain-containing protein [Holosporales bacterium]|jgi:uncharacterized protein (DUF1015 family)|nr:DUF1015 domain-containing protein [Holosporales bacterium]
MKIKQFKLTSFSSEYWKSNDLSSFLDNSDTKDKVSRTTKIMEFLKSKIASGVAKTDATPGLYILKFHNDTKCVISLIAEVNYDGKNVFVPNEEIHPDKLSAYKKIFDSHRMQINPILTFYEGGTSIKEIAAPFMQSQPRIEANVNGDKYSLWEIKNPLDLQHLQTSLLFIDKLYIADGHHRFAVFNESITKNTGIMVAITDSESIILASCHRVVMQNIASNWKEKITRYCTLEKLNTAPKNINATIIKLRNGEMYRAIFKYNIHENASFHEAIENDIISSSFGITDKANKIFPLPGVLTLNDSDSIFGLYQDSSAIIFIPNIEIYEFLNTIRNGKKLPPTSTWFEPKIIDGFIIMKL